MEGLISDGFHPLPDCALLHIQGPDAAAFLHGQLTQAVTGLTGEKAVPAAYCTAQGRLLANGVLWQTQAEQFTWMVSRDLAEGLIKRLRMFVLRARVSIELDTALQVWGALGASAVPAGLHPATAWTQALIGDACWIVAPMSRISQPAAWRIAQTGVDLASPDGAAWVAARLAGGWPWIQAAAREQFLPAALDMDLNGTIDFAKGCYPGQEVVARSHYRGTVKRRMAYGTAPWAPGTPAPSPAADLYLAGDASGRPGARIIEAVAHQGTLHVAAEITLADWPTARYAVGSPQGVVLDLREPRGR